MRKKINYQSTDYAENGELLCFGLSEHVMEERNYKLSEKAEAHVKLLRQWFDESMFEEHCPRPAFKSDNTAYISHVCRGHFRMILGLLFIRELPIKSFYSRAFIGYWYFTWVYHRSLAKGVSQNHPNVIYNHPIFFKTLLNYQDLFYWSIGKVLPKVPNTPSAHLTWEARQKPVFHQYHKQVYRYRYRRPRYVPWDGTQNQPVMPFALDQGTGVINGTWKRNTNTCPELK